MMTQTDPTVRVARTVQGDTVDTVCYRYFGTTHLVTEQVLALNPNAQGVTVFDAGVELVLPVELPIPKKTVVTLWD